MLLVVYRIIDAAVHTIDQSMRQINRARCRGRGVVGWLWLRLLRTATRLVYAVVCVNVCMYVDLSTVLFLRIQYIYPDIDRVVDLISSLRPLHCSHQRFLPCPLYCVALLPRRGAALHATAKHLQLVNARHAVVGLGHACMLALSIDRSWRA